MNNIQANASGEMQITSKHLSGAKTREFFTHLAEVINPNDEVVGSLDLNAYGFQSSFSLADGAVIAVSMFRTKGGVL